MTFLFGRGPFIHKLFTIVRLTRLHAMNLAKFVFGYKLTNGYLQRFVSGRRRQWHALLTAGLVGYVVFGENNSVNMQINLYLLSRVLVGLARTAVNSGMLPEPTFPVFPWFAAGVWALVLWLFEHHQRTLQPSLQQSMTYLYHDSDNWTGTLWDFVMTSHSTA